MEFEILVIKELAEEMGCKMQKPQYKRENGLLVKKYPEFMLELEASVAEGMNNVRKEELEQLCDAVYRSGYMDGFSAGTFFSDGL